MDLDENVEQINVNRIYMHETARIATAKRKETLLEKKKISPIRNHNGNIFSFSLYQSSVIASVGRVVVILRRSSLHAR